MMRLAFLCWLAAVTAASALEPPRDFTDAAQDGSGVLWAYRHSYVDSVYRFAGHTWEKSDALFDRDEESRFLQVATLADGAVACVWQLKDQRIAVTRHFGTESRLLGTCGCDLPENSGRWDPPLADSQGRLWITGPCAGIYRADAKGVALVHRITSKELEAPVEAGGRYNAVHAAEDGRGRVWVWSDFFSGASPLRGVLIFTGETAKRHDLLASLGENAKILALTRADERHMWIAVFNKGIYRIDIDSLALEQVPGPSDDALSEVRELHVDGGDLYAVEAEEEGSSLWRWRGGQWTRLVPQLDRHRNESLHRSWLALKDGWLVSSFGVDGPWYIPREGGPAQFSWRSGFALENAYSLARLPDGTFFGIGDYQDLFHGALSFPPRDQPIGRVSVIDTRTLDPDQGWMGDAAAHLWTVLAESPRSLSEWNGNAWVAHPIPGAEAVPAWESNGPKRMLTDAEGRVWVPWDGRKKALSVFDSATGEWQTFTGVRDAYVKLRDRPPHFLRLHSVSEVLLDPQYSADHQRIAYRDGTTDFYYYEGSAWQHFTSRQIAGKKENDRGLGPPWFDPAGRMCVNLFRQATWRRAKDGHWAKTAFESHFPADLWSERELHGTEVQPPPGCVTDDPVSIVADNLGTDWLTWKHGLYRCVPGRCVKVLGDDEATPFASLRYLQEVYVDSCGNAFLRMGSNAKEVMMIRPMPSAPHVTVAVEPVGADGVEAQLHAESALPVQWRWRLDEGPWQPTEKSALTLIGLSNGAHMLSVSAVDANLQMEADPAVAKFEIKIDPDRQMADLIARLSIPDDDQRKAAVEALARQPDRAVRALQQARGTAENDQRWWIDASLQQISSARTASPSASPAPAH